MDGHGQKDKQDGKVVAATRVCAFKLNWVISDEMNSEI